MSNKLKSANRYLESNQRYIDLYDLFTIKKCLKIVDTYREVYQQSLKEKKLKGVSKEEKERSINQMLHWKLFAVKAEEYQQKEKLVEEWMDEDRKKQEKYDNTPEPPNITCSDCGAVMHTTYKHLEVRVKQPLRVLFFLDCSDCKKRKGIYENGKEKKTKPIHCDKCNKPVKTDTKRKGDVITWTWKCKACGHTKTDVDDLAKSEEEWKQQEIVDKELLKRFRSEYCLTEKQGKEHLDQIEAMQVASVVYDEEIQKFDSSAYQKAAKLKRVNIVDLEKRLQKPLKKAQYVKLTFDKPEIGRHLIIPFSVQDADSARQRMTSVHDLKQLLKETLKNTNWRLMSGGVSYRLGYISSRIRGYENEEDLLKISGQNNKTKQQTTIDPEMRAKHEYSTWVKWAKLSAKMKSVENVRKQRLKKEPNGFFLEASEGPYQCCICREYHPGNRIWWKPDGLRCADCWRNIQERVIPALVWENEGIYIRESDVKFNYRVHPSTRRKLEREGFLKGRHLKRPDGDTYCTIYLVKENKEFFKRYPKNPEYKIKLSWDKEKGGLLLDVIDDDKKQKTKK